MTWQQRIAAFAALAVMTPVLGCEHDPRPKQRPSGVPLAAVWQGNGDGGAYYNCSAGGPANECTVWNDGTGETMASGPFLLQEQKRSAYSDELDYVSFDGKNIHLKGGLVLAPAPKPAAAKK